MEIKNIKAHLNILHIAQDLGIQIDPRNKRAHCPFHNDKTPSLQFSEEKQLATCFSSNCTAGSMDVIELVKRKNNWELPETLQYLKQKVGAAAAQVSTLTISHNKLSEQERILLLTQLFDLFERAFLASKPAKDYAESRNINHKLIQIGYNSGTFHHSVNLPEKNREELLANYEELGLLKKFNTGHTVFGKGCLVFPLKNEKNQIVSFYFREIDDTKPNKHYYLKQRSGLYPNYPESNTNHIILTECIIDAISLKQSIANNYTILANYGTEGNKEQIEAISQLNHLEEITLFFDGDAAGQAAAAKHIEQLNQRCPGVKLSTVQTPENEDINSLLLSHEPEIFTHLIQSAAPFFLSEVIESRHSSSGEKENKPQQAKEKTLGGNDQPQLILTLKGNLLKSEESLKVTIEALNVQTGKKLRDKVELYEYKQVDRFIKTIAEKLSLPEYVADDSIHAFIEELEEKRYRMKVQSPNKNQEQALNPKEMEECINFGKQPNLIEELNNLIGKSGIVGEEKNRLFLFGIASSHKMKKTLHVVVQGSSGSGKTHLIKKVADLMPQENVKRFTRISEKSFYNYGEHDLVNHLIVLEDYDGMKEEAEFALRELQSNEILISSTSKKDETTGEIKSGENKVRGPIASMVATTHGEMYHDNETRVFFISIDETEEQTHKIINYKNQLSAGEINQREQEEATLFIQRFIRSLQPKEVKNTWIKHIDLPVHPDQKRRLHSLFQAFCEQVTLLHQHQRQQDDHGRLITQKQDIELAIDLMFESIILKVDELNGRLRDFYENIKAYIKPNGKEYAFTRMEIRQFTKLGNTKVHENLHQLEEMEYIQKIHAAKHNTHNYKVVYWDDQEALRKRIKQSITQQLEKI